MRETVEKHYPFKISMWNPIKSLFECIFEEFGHPVTLQRLIPERPDLRVQLIEPERVIASDSVVKWQEWGNTWPPQNRGLLIGRTYEPGEYESCQIRRQEIENFVQCKITEDWICDIQDVSGFSASTSNLTAFYTLDDMVTTDSPEMIDSITEEKLAQNLAWKGIGILHDPNSGDRFVQYQWDGRLFLINSNGSHHFAAARYIAARIGKPVPLKGKLYTYSIDPLAVDGLKRDFEMFAVSNTPDLYDLFNDAMKAGSATFYWYHLPTPHNHARLILLPRKNKRSMRVSDVLRDAGFLDAGIYLSGLAQLNTA